MSAVSRKWSRTVVSVLAIILAVLLLSVVRAHTTAGAPPTHIVAGPAVWWTGQITVLNGPVVMPLRFRAELALRGGHSYVGWIEPDQYCRFVLLERAMSQAAIQGGEPPSQGPGSEQIISAPWDPRAGLPVVEIWRLSGDGRLSVQGCLAESRLEISGRTVRNWNGDQLVTLDAKPDQPPVWDVNATSEFLGLPLSGSGRSR
jgi:hypothetical protein